MAKKKLKKKVAKKKAAKKKVVRKKKAFTGGSKKKIEITEAGETDVEELPLTTEADEEPEESEDAGDDVETLFDEDELEDDTEH